MQIRTYQSVDGQWIATDDAGAKVYAATEAAALAQFRADFPDIAAQSDEAAAREAEERMARRRGLHGKA